MKSSLKLQLDIEIEERKTENNKCEMLSTQQLDESFKIICELLNLANLNSTWS